MAPRPRVPRLVRLAGLPHGEGVVATVTCRDTKQIRINITRARIDLALEAGDRRKFVQLAMLLRDLKRQAS